MKNSLFTAMQAATFTQTFTLKMSCMQEAHSSKAEWIYASAMLTNSIPLTANSIGL